MTTAPGRADHAFRPLVLDAAEAHRTSTVVYDREGNVTLRHAALGGPVMLGPDRQFPCILPTFLALDKALSNAAASPHTSSGLSLREAFDREYGAYLGELASTSARSGRFEPHYGSYVYDRHARAIYLVAPAEWHRLALLTSNAKLLTDPKGEMTAEQIRGRLGTTVVGFVGASLGSNVIEGVVREMRPYAAKLADPDYLEATNLNRLERGSLRYLSQPRSSRRDPRNPFETLFVNKARLVAYEQQLVDPYAQWFLYEEGIGDDNIDRFLLGDGDEPALDYVVEEADDLRVKLEIRKRARTHGIPVFMASDLGHRSQVQLQDFRAKPGAALGYRISDEELFERFERCTKSADRAELFRFVEGLVGEGFAVDEYADWVSQKGERPTSSIPQSGSVAQLSGALCGKLIALHRLGHAVPERIVFDARRLELGVD